LAHVSAPSCAIVATTVRAVDIAAVPNVAAVWEDSMRTRLRLVVGAVALMATVLAPSPASAAPGDISTSITITSITVDAQAAFIPTTFHVSMSTSISEPAPCPASLKIYEVVDAVDVFVASNDDFCAYGGIADIVYQPGFDIGTHTFKAKWEIDPTNHYASSESPTAQLTVIKTDSFVNLGSGFAPVEAHSTFTLETPVDAWTSKFAENTTVTVTRTGLDTPICVIPVVVENTMQCDMTFPTPGVYTLTGTYSGNTWSNGSNAQTQVTVVADTVHASPSVQYTTFYPVKDSYRDTVAIRGTRDEVVGVTIKVYSPSGSLLKTVSIASGTGAYNYNWNGRNSAGTIYASGKYKVVQTLKDGAGATKVVTSYVTLSKKKLYTYTKTITKKGSSVTAKGAAVGGKVTLSTTSGYAKLYAPTLFTSWAGAGWELTLPSATIYKSFYVRVYGRHSGPMGDTSVSAQNFASCPYVAGSSWDVSCFDAPAQLSSTSGTTLHYYKTANLSSSHRAGTKVRVSVSSYYGTTYIYKAQVVVTYQVLK
jgi:FlgD Ig-like domain